MDILIHPNYFPNIDQFTQIIKANNILFEVSDNYQKQTFRNRTYIYGANGKLGLFIPVIHTHKKRELFKDVKYIDVRSKTIGKGFAGPMKRWKFSV